MASCPHCNSDMGRARVCPACGKMVGAASDLQVLRWVVAGVVAFVVLSIVVGFAMVPSGGVRSNDSKRVEVNFRMGELQRARATFLESNDAGPRSFEALEFEFNPHRRYAYFVGDDAVQPDTQNYGPYARPDAGDDVVFTAVSNLDEDEALDVWVGLTDGGVSQRSTD